MLQRIYGGGLTGSLRVLHADPKVLIADELLDQIRRGDCDPAVRLVGDVLYIDAENCRLIYRIGESVPAMSAYWMEWPD